jgi:hypothetical protein
MLVGIPTKIAGVSTMLAEREMYKEGCQTYNFSFRELEASARPFSCRGLRRIWRAVARKLK